MLEKAIFITEETNEKAKRGFDSYKYYVVGLKIDGVDYTAKMVVGVKNGQTYYDHALTEISKEKLLNERDRISTSVYQKEQSFDINNVKDKRLLSILEENSSKILDENGEPLVVYHGTFDRNATGKFSKFNTPAFFSSDEETARIFSRDLANEALGKLNEKYKIQRPEGARGYVYPIYLNIIKPKYIDFRGKAWGSDYKQTQEFEDAVKALKDSDKYDGVIALNIIEGGNNKIGTVTTTYVVKDPSQIKSADPVTYDDQGNVIPLSERFNSENNDIRFQKEKLDTKEVIKEQGLLQGEEKEKAREKLLATEPIEVTPNTIQTKDGKSASRVAMEWVDENQPEPIVAMTEVGEVTIDKRSIKDSLGHGFGQKKLDTITSLGQAFKEKKATYIGAMRDMDGKNQMNYYFAYPITYNGEENFVFCRATKDESKNRLYVHEVFTLDEIQGNSLQPSMSKTQSRGTSLYKNIIADILNAKVQQNSETDKLKLQKVTERVVEKATDKALEEVKDPILKRAYKGILKESTKDKWYSFADDYHALRVMEDKVIEEMRKRDPKFRLHHSVYEQQIAAKAATGDD